MKTFTIGGTSTGPDGLRQWRFANGDPAVREAVLRKHAHTDVKFLALPRAMTKEEGIAWLTEQGITAEVLIPGRKSVEVVFAGVSEDGAVPAASKRTVRVVNIAPVSRPKTPAEMQARKLHKKEPFVRWLAWDHLNIDTRKSLIARAEQQMAA